ncbi:MULTISPECIES: DUF6159 family protein [unclassified Luteimonas]|uniref:DUF6159 family protein n=1 Tax=unclassified Luteimonas TaxID=2629088 RepID=UPI0016014702|nr:MULTISPECIES: DUF6159 family protein [unclassified Luteimonas]MBB1473080.1 hypothetical protein [Luteimonas sp. MC1782]MBB6598216.1 hypothetical protein [Luteimonas sp. MC1825]QOC88437.1 hypothetical protein IDM46_01305 [Luteimonas sp. MC1825]
MFEKVSRSWEMVKASAAVLRSDKELMLFPILSGLATLAVLATFLVPALALRMFSGGFGIGAVIGGFVFYFCTYSVVIFFNCALVGAAMIRLDGGDPTLADGFAAARGRLGAIFGYAAIAATVGVLLQGMKNKDNGFLVRLLGSGLGAAWTLAAFLVVPVLVSRNVGPVDALKDSLALLKRTWGENAVGQVGIGAAFGLLTGGAVLLSLALVVLAAQASVVLAVAVGVICAVGVIVLAIYQAALTGIYSAVLYRYAVAHEIPAAFQGAQLATVFAPKR